MLTETNLPTDIQKLGFNFPEGYRLVFRLGLVNLDVWQFVTDSSEFEGLFKTLNGDATEYFLIPFARRVDNDDVACFVVKTDSTSEEAVGIQHLYSTAEIEMVGKFWDWFKLAVNELIELHNQ
jgi:hypothetical protein